MGFPNVLYVVSFVIITLSAHVSCTNCPQGCGCDASKQEMTCTGLKKLPSAIPVSMTTLTCFRCQLWDLSPGDLDGMKTLEKLILSSAHISNIAPYAFAAFQNLKTLDLSGNDMRILDATAFSGCINLQELVLHSNNLEDNTNVFDPLPHLKYLILHSNKFRFIPKNIFTNLNNLKSLRLDWNLIEEVPPFSFFGLSSLEDVNLLANQIHTIHDGAFEGMNNLKMLLIGRNKLTSLDPRIFRPLSSLETLSFFSNQVSVLQPRQFEYLPNLLDLQTYGNGFSKVAPSAFQGLHKLKSLHLPINNIKVISKDLFVGLISLQKLSLESNGMITIDQDAFQPLQSLTDLMLRNNSLNIKDGSVFSPLKNLKNLYMQSTQATQIPSNLDLPELKNIQLGDNDISHLPDDLGLRNCPKLEFIGLNNNKITTLSLTHVANLKALRYLTIQNNLITTFDESLKPLFSRYTHWRIDGNPLHCNCELAWLKSLRPSIFYNRYGGYNLRCATPHLLMLLRDTTDADFKCIKPRFVTDKTRILSSSGDNNLVMSCMASGDPSPKISWHYIYESSDGQRVQSSYRDAKVNDGSHGNTLLSSDTLDIPRSSIPSSYKAFVCRAENRAGSVETTISI